MKRIQLLSKIFCFSLLIFCFKPSLKAQKDTIPPVIVYLDNDTTCVGISSIWVRKDAIVSDNQTDTMYINVKYSWEAPNGALNTFVRGIYVMVIKATDLNGNKSTLKVHYRVDDCIPPVIDLNTNDTVCVKYRTPYISIAPTATDNYYSKSQISLVLKSSNVDPNVKGIYQEVFEAVDGSGNITTKTRFVIVTDNCATTASLNQLALMQLDIHPNPASDYIAINLTNVYSSEPLVITIVSMDGKQVFESTIDKGLKIDVSHFSNGVYSVGLKGGGKVINKVFVIQH